MTNSVTTYSELIPEVRQRIDELFENHPDQYDQVDIGRIVQDDWSVLRFIKNNRGDINKSVEQLNTSLQWRHIYGVNKNTINDFPQEFYKIGVVFINGVDQSKRPVLYLRLRAYKRYTPFVPVFKQFLVSYIEKVDRDANEQGFIILLDASGSRLANVDMEFVQFIVNTLRDHYPQGLQHVLVYNLPRLIRPFFMIAKLLFSVLKIDLQCLNDQELRNMIPKEHLPFYLGGRNKYDFTAPPEGSIPLREAAPKYGFLECYVQKNLEIYEPIIVHSENLILGYSIV